MAIDYKIRLIIKDFGHIKIDDLMREVLSINPSSYYRSKTSIGADGDFITSPEISQLFGETIGFWVINKWQEMGCPQKFALVELGPGQGILMRDLMRVAKLLPEFMEAVEIFLYEINQNFIKKQKNNLAFIKQKIHWINNINKLPPIPCIIISNEFFDALPVKQYIKSRHIWYESVIVCDPTDGLLKFDKIELNKALFNQLNIDHINAQDGALIEESAESLEITRKIAIHLMKFKGVCLTIDYGYNIELCNRTRNQYNSTLQAIKNHQYHSIIDSLGEADLTTHVDFNALKNAALQKGIKNITISSQHDFLVNNGIIIRQTNLKSLAQADYSSILDNQLYRLIAKEQMGEIFKVMEYTSF
jgi:NADH dehydrogenase [ubiquinone] 1 alpha subcomplex assembly factor 7